MVYYQTTVGDITISNEYFCKLIGHAVSSCYGVVDMVPKGFQRVRELVSRKENIDTGIKVIGNADSVSVEIHVAVMYGMNISAIAKSIVNKVKYTVKEATGITVDKVTVMVDGIRE